VAQATVFVGESRRGEIWGSKGVNEPSRFLPREKGGPIKGEPEGKERKSFSPKIRPQLGSNTYQRATKESGGNCPASPRNQKKALARVIVGLAIPVSRQNQGACPSGRQIV